MKLLIPLILVGMTRSSQIAQCNKHAKSSQNLNEKLWNKVDFCADEHHSYLYIDTVVSD